VILVFVTAVDTISLFPTWQKELGTWVLLPSL